MKPKLYLFVFDPAKSNPYTIHPIITGMPLKSDWWHYIGPAYILASTSSAIEISNYLNARSIGSFMLTEINAHNSGGWLPKAAWDWINARR